VACGGYYLNLFGGGGHRFFLGDGLGRRSREYYVSLKRHFLHLSHKERRGQVRYVFSFRLPSSSFLPFFCFFPFLFFFLQR
jgi:hypothetical protein